MRSAPPERRSVMIWRMAGLTFTASAMSHKGVKCATIQAATMAAEALWRQCLYIALNPNPRKKIERRRKGQAFMIQPMNGVAFGTFVFVADVSTRTRLSRPIST